MRESRPKEQATCVPHCQSSSPAPVLESSTDPSGNDSSSTLSNSDLLIAVRKGVRLCTQHPIARFVSYEFLSLAYRAFVSSLSSACIPQGWKEAINDSK